MGSTFLGVCDKHGLRLDCHQRCKVLEESGKHSVGSPHLTLEVKPNIPRSPYKAAMILPLIARTIAEMPMASNKNLCLILEPYSKPYCFKEAIIQRARTEACKLIFGDADNNVGYAHFVKEDLQKARHFVELSFNSRKATMQNLDKIIIANEVLCWKNAKLDRLPSNERKAFIKE